MRDTCNQSVNRGREAMQQLVGGDGRKKKQMLQKKDLQREGWCLKPRRGSCGSSCLLKQKCDTTPPGPVNMLRTNEQQGIDSLSSLISHFLKSLLFFLVQKCKKQ